ncbi:glycoside hydrolase family 16 protein [Belliella pelovolcani]|uniref:Glycosyl hydrolases family 16 n=1 Tax=Belliella pelovolcani TaxID=529505 RepID=A0A1N7LRA0_9BACT|nr:glycoside hydrolase family 16 protein [Belliella pelovolcani]SIS76366.1 Glycosyl hydrolases family 16 [Belliella pelovolcani]
MNKLNLFFPILAAIGISCNQSVTIPENELVVPEGYKLVWHDEFALDGKPDENFWTYEIGLKRNNELQYYQPENANIKDGLLILEGKREKVKNEAYDPNSNDWKKNQEFAKYTSASINTKGKKSFQYGIIEVRAKIDTAIGMWPAIWTLGESQGWPANGEIDIMEYYQVNGEGTLLANAAWASSDKRAAWDKAKIPIRKFIERDPEWAEKFHVWKMDWNQDYIRLYLDDELLNEVDLARTINPDGFNPFQQPHFILLNLAIGSNGGDPSTTTFPKEYLVDYVRVFQKK